MGILTPEKGIFKEPHSVFGKTLLTVIFILFATRMLTRTPLVNIYVFFEGFYYLLIFPFTIFYILYIGLQRRAIDEIHYYFFLMFWLPIQAGVCANLSEGFPILSGYFAQRHWIGVSGIFVVILMLQTNFITLKDLFRAFEWIAWLCFVYFIGCYLFLDPKAYLDTSFVGYSDIKGGYRFKFGIDFIAFFALYYTIKYVQKRDGKWLFLSGVMLSYLFFLHQGRSVMIAELGCLVIYYLVEVNWQRVLRIFGTIGIVFILIMSVMYMIIPDRVNDYIFQYTSLLTVVLTGQSSGESSVDARLEEIAIVFLYLETYSIGWVIGVGKFASGESSGTQIHDITTVPPGDIGIIGSVMTYGIIGTLIIYSQFLIAIRSLKFVRRYNKNVFLMTAKYFLFFCFLTSLAKGYLFMQPGGTAVFIMIIYCYKLVEVSMDKKGAPVIIDEDSTF